MGSDESDGNTFRVPDSWFRRVEYAGSYL
jgi:hypothetical protein